MGWGRGLLVYDSLSGILSCFGVISFVFVMDKLIVFDTTLRDGEQSPGASMSLRQKLEVARALARLKVDVIEVGFPAASTGDFEAVYRIASELKGVCVAALARCLEGDIVSGAKAIAPAKDFGHLHLFLGTSKVHRECQLGKSCSDILEMAVRSVRLACDFSRNIEFSPEDASRTEFDFLVDVCSAVTEAGAKVVNIPDTVGYAMPDEFGSLIRRLVERVEAFRTGKAIVSVHCHNDLGMAVANSLAAVRAGARQVECTLNGLGERAGNAALEEVVMSVLTRSDIYGLECGVNTKELVRASKIVSRASGFEIPRNKAIIGLNAFSHASGIHQDGILKDHSTYEIIRPEDVGWGGSELPLTKHSGRAAVGDRLKQLGFKVNSAELAAVFKRFKEIGDCKKYVFDEDLIALTSGLASGIGVCVWELEKIQYLSGSGIIPTATIILRKNGVRQKGEPKVSLYQDADTGDGPVDAIFQTIKRITDREDAQLEDFSIRATSGGQDAVGEVTVRLRFGDRLLVLVTVIMQS